MPDVDYAEMLKSFKGERAIVLSTMTPLGGAQFFLGLTFVLAGALILAFGVGYKYCIDPHELYIFSRENMNLPN